jgi:hypothetical protein
MAIIFAAYFVFYIFVGREGADWRDNFKEAFIRWDGANFLQVAEDGYQSMGEFRFNLVYLPVYPYGMDLGSAFHGFPMRH